MGNQPSQRAGKDDRENTDDDKGDDCQPPCLAWLPSLARTQDPMGSPLPETPLVTRQRRKHVADALRQENKNNHHGMAAPPVSLGSLLPPRVNSTASGRTYLKPEANIHQPPPPQQAPVHEGPHAEALLLQTYELLEVLGVGSTSTVQKCRHRETNQVYACKIIDITQMEERFQGMMAQFQTEISALRQLHHAAIIRLLDVYQTPAKIYIVMECMEGGELFDYVVQKGTLTEEEASQIVRKVTGALVYMHAQNIVHRDLKPENLLLKRKPVAGDRSIDVKIIDFGLSKAMEEPVARTFLGTRGYLAPEMLQRRDYTRAVDTWSLGVIVFVLLCGCLPFDDDSATVPSDDLVRAKFVLRFPRWAKHLSASAKDLLTHLLDVNPTTRYTAEQAYRHPWVQGKTASKQSLLQSPGRIRASPAVRNGRKYAPPNRQDGPASPGKERVVHPRKNSL